MYSRSLEGTYGDRYACSWKGSDHGDSQAEVAFRRLTMVVIHRCRDALA